MVKKKKFDKVVCIKKKKKKGRLTVSFFPKELY